MKGMILGWGAGLIVALSIQVLLLSQGINVGFFGGVALGLVVSLAGVVVGGKAFDR